MNIEVGSVFYTAKDNKKGTIVQIDKVAKTGIIEMEDGSTKAQSFTTFKDKRRWIPANEDDQYVAEVMQQKKDLGIECPKIESYETMSDQEWEESAKPVKELSDEEYAKIGLEIAEQAKQKAMVTKKSVEVGIGTDIKDYVVSVAENLGADICESNGRFISFKVNNKMFAAIFSYSKKSLTLGVRGKAIEGKTNPDSVANHMMDARFKFDNLSDNVEELIRLILEAAFNYQVNLKK